MELSKSSLPMMHDEDEDRIYQSQTDAMKNIFCCSDFDADDMLGICLEYMRKYGRGQTHSNWKKRYPDTIKTLKNRHRMIQQEIFDKVKQVVTKLNQKNIGIYFRAYNDNGIIKIEGSNDVVLWSSEDWYCEDIKWIEKEVLSNFDSILDGMKRKSDLMGCHVKNESPCTLCSDDGGQD